MPDFNTLQPVQAQPNFGSLGAVSQPTSAGTTLVDHGSPAANIWANLAALPGQLGQVASKFPGAQIGSAIGNSVATLGTAASELAKGNPGIAGDTLKRGVQEQNANFGKTAGDAAQAVALPASLALGGGTGATAAARIGTAALKYGAVGALGGGGAAAAGGGDLGATATGALEGGALGAAGGALGQSAGEIYSHFSKPAGDEFINQLVTPQQTTGKTGTLTKNIKAGSVQEGGVVSGRTITPNAQQVAIENEVKTVPGISPQQTLLQNANSIHDEIGVTAQNLRTQLSQQEVQPILQPEDIQKLVADTKAKIGENPVLVGDAQVSAERILNKFQSLLPKNGDITAENVLDARQSLDNWMRDIKGGTVFDPKTENAVSIALRAVRQGANGILADKAPDVAVGQMLRRQTLLYDALDNIAPKAAKEAGSILGRMTQTVKNHPVISTITGLTGADIILHKIGL